MMKCKKTQQKLSAYMDDALSPKEMEAVRSHLEECDFCTHMLDELSITIDRLHSLPEMEIPEGLHESIMAQIRTVQPEKPSFYTGSRFNWQGPVAYAASVLVVFLVMSGMLTGVNSFQKRSGSGSPADRPMSARFFPESDLIISDAAVAGESFGYSQEDMEESVEAELDGASGQIDEPMLQSGGMAMEAPMAMMESMDAGPGYASETSVSGDYLVKSFSAHLVVEDVAEAVFWIESWPGWTVQSFMENESGWQYAEIERRVLDQDYTMLKQELAGLGRVAWAVDFEENVTGRYLDLSLQKSGKETEVERLWALLSQSTTMEVMTAVERRLGTTESQLDRIQGEMRQLEQQWQNPIMTITLESSQPVIAQEEEKGFGQQVRDAWIGSLNATILFMETMLLICSSIFLPFLLIFCVGAGGYGIYRYVRKRRGR